MSLFKVIEQVQPLNKDVMLQVQEHANHLAKPVGSLGRIEELAIQLAGITNNERPNVQSPAIVVAAGDHGIVNQGVSAYPQEVTKLMLNNFVNGGAAINVFARQIGAKVSVVDVGVNGEIGTPKIINKKVKNGTNDFFNESAMSHTEAIQSIEVGMEVAKKLIEDGHKLLITGEMGIGNTTASSALISALTKEPVEVVVGCGTGLSEESLNHKISIIKTALEKHQIDPNEPLETFSKIGGLEIGALAGVILMGAARNIPVIVDGLISSAGALVAYKLCPNVLDHLIISHRSVEPGHKAIFRFLNKEPLLSLDLRLGEGTGAALSYPLLDAACRITAEMATFADLGIEKK